MTGQPTRAGALSLCALWLRRCAGWPHRRLLPTELHVRIAEPRADRARPQLCRTQPRGLSIRLLVSTCREHIRIGLHGRCQPVSAEQMVLEIGEPATCGDSRTRAQYLPVGGAGHLEAYPRARADAPLRGSAWVPLRDLPSTWETRTALLGEYPLDRDGCRAYSRSAATRPRCSTGVVSMCKESPVTTTRIGRRGETLYWNGVARGRRDPGGP